MSGVTSNSKFSLESFSSLHPELSEPRARKRWANWIYSQWEEGENVPLEIIRELAAHLPYFAPDPFAEKDILSRRYAHLVTKRMVLQEWALSENHAKLVSLLGRKVYRKSPEKEHDLRLKITKVFSELNAVREELSQRKNGIMDGPIGSSMLASIVSHKVNIREENARRLLNLSK